MQSREPFVRLATLGDLASAQVFAARLGAAGIPARLHGEALGPYRVTVGDMAATQVWVGRGDAGEARRLLDEAGLGGFADDSPDTTPRLGVPVPLVFGALAIVALMVLIRLLLLL